MTDETNTDQTNSETPTEASHTPPIKSSHPLYPQVPSQFAFRPTGVVGPVNGSPNQIIRTVLEQYGNRASQTALEKMFTDESVSRCVTSGFLEEVANTEVGGVTLGVTEIGRRQLAEIQTEPFGPGTPEIVAARQMAISAIIRVKHPEYLSAFNGGEFPMGRVGAHPMMTQTSQPKLHQFSDDQSLAYYRAVADTSKKQIVDLSSKLRILTRGVLIAVGVCLLIVLVGLVMFGMTQFNVTRI